jgi:hypothetical protein
MTCRVLLCITLFEVRNSVAIAQSFIGILWMKELRLKSLCVQTHLPQKENDKTLCPSVPFCVQFAFLKLLA